MGKKKVVIEQDDEESGDEEVSDVGSSAKKSDDAKEKEDRSLWTGKSFLTDKMNAYVQQFRSQLERGSGKPTSYMSIFQQGGGLTPGVPPYYPPHLHGKDAAMEMYTRVSQALLEQDMKDKASEMAVAAVRHWNERPRSTSSTSSLPRSNYFGVFWDPETNMWSAKYNTIPIGFFKDEKDAAKAVDRKIVDTEGSHVHASRLNFPDDIMQSMKPLALGSDRRGSSIYRGVLWDKSTRSWRAKIKTGGKTKYLGLFQNEKDAARAYDRAAVEIRGCTATLNFPEDYPQLPKEAPKKGGSTSRNSSTARSSSSAVAAASKTAKGQEMLPRYKQVASGSFKCEFFTPEEVDEYKQVLGTVSYNDLRLLHLCHIEPSTLKKAVHTGLKVQQVFLRHAVAELQSTEAACKADLDRLVSRARTQIEEKFRAEKKLKRSSVSASSTSTSSSTKPAISNGDNTISDPTGTNALFRREDFEELQRVVGVDDALLGDLILLDAFKIHPRDLCDFDCSAVTISKWNQVTKIVRLSKEICEVRMRRLVKLANLLKLEGSRTRKRKTTLPEDEKRTNTTKKANVGAGPVAISPSIEEMKRQFREALWTDLKQEIEKEIDKRVETKLLEILEDPNTLTTLELALAKKMKKSPANDNRERMTRNSAAASEGSTASA